MNGTFLLFSSKINGYIFIPLLFLCGCIGWRIFCLSLSNCSLNHSAMGFRSMARTSLVPSVGSFLMENYETHIFFLSFLACETMIFCIFGGGKCRPRWGVQRGLPLALLGNFQRYVVLRLGKFPNKLRYFLRKYPAACRPSAFRLWLSLPPACP